MTARLMHEAIAKRPALQVQIALLERGLTIRSWALANGYDPSTVWRCVHLGYRGRRSTEIARRLDADLFPST